MSLFVEVRALSAPADEVAALVLDWSRDRSWRAAVTAIDVVPPGPARPGQQVVEQLRFAGCRFTTPTTVQDADGTRASYRGGSRAVTVRGTRSVVPDGAGGCTLRLETDVRLRGLLAPLTPLLAPGYRRRARADADAVAALLGAARPAGRHREPAPR